MPRLSPLLLLAGLTLPLSAQDHARPAVRYVRIELPGKNRVLSLAEVQVFRDGVNVAQGKPATQIETSNDAPAARAVDGRIDGVFNGGSVTHTPELNNAWWEVDLGDSGTIDQLTVWNRTDCCGERLDEFTLLLLDDERNTAWRMRSLPAPKPRADFLPWGGELLGESHVIPAAEKMKMQPAINTAIDRGAAYLLRVQLRDGSWSHESKIYPGGQTGLAVYTLIKSGLPVTHPGVERGLAYLRAHRPNKTYAMGCTLLALGAAKDPRDQALMEGILDDLISTQGQRAEDQRVDEMWSYPGTPSHLVDLSNTQYAALGLLAAHRAGLRVPKKVWVNLATDTLRYQEKPHEVVSSVYVNERKSGEGREVAGFKYRRSTAATGAMTAAGIAILSICREGLGISLPSRTEREIGQATELALAWLGHNFTVDANPGQAAWHDYYLYGLERVGSLLGLDAFDGRQWYWEGAANIIKRQKDVGNWGNDAETCFALLFLERATAPSSGERRGGGALFISEDEDAPVRFRGTGSGTLTFWVTGFSEATRATHADKTVGGLRVQRVEYLIGEEVIASLEGDPRRAWEGQRYAIQHELSDRGEYIVTVRVVIYTGGEAETGKATHDVVSKPLTVKIDDVHEPARLRYAAQASQNLLQRTKVTVESSSFNVEGQKPETTVDGLHGTYWCAKKEDAEPTLAITLAKPQKGDTLLLSHVNLHADGRDDHDRAKRVLVYINKAKDPIELIMPSRDEEKGVLKLPKPVALRQLKLVIVGRETGDKHPGFVGFSEVEWILGE